MISAEEQKKMELLQMLDRGIDDVLSGRVLPYEEAREKLEELRKIRRDERAKVQIKC